MLLTAALVVVALGSSAARADRLVFDDQVICCAELPPLPVPEVSIRPVRLPESSMPPALQPPQQALDEALAHLDAWQRLHSNPPTSPEVMLERLETLGATIELRRYRRALRREERNVVLQHLREEVAVREAAVQRATAQRDAALLVPQDDPAAELWRRLWLADAQPEQRAEHARVLREDYPDGPHLERILYLSGTALPDRLGDLEVLLSRFPDTELATVARMHLARAALLRDDPVAATQLVETIYGVHEAGLLYIQALLRLGDHSEALHLLISMQDDPSPVLDVTTARALLEVSQEQDIDIFALLDHALSRPGVLGPFADGLAARGRWEECAVMLRALLLHADTLPDAPQRSLQLARLYDRSREPEQAAMIREDIIDRYAPDGVWAHHWRTHEEVLAAGLAVWEDTVRMRATARHARAQLSGEADDYARAAEDYRLIGVHTPQDQLLLIDALLGSGRAVEARTRFQQLIGEHPDTEEARRAADLLSGLPECPARIGEWALGAEMPCPVVVDLDGDARPDTVSVVAVGELVALSVTLGTGETALLGVPGGTPLVEVFGENEPTEAVESGFGWLVGWRSTEQGLWMTSTDLALMLVKRPEDGWVLLNLGY